MANFLLSVAVTAFVVLASANAAQLVCDDPAYLIAPGSDLYKMHRLFNATGSSRRFFSEIHYHEPSDPNLTMGMGHWIDTKLARMFARLRADQDMWDEVVRAWVPLLSSSHWEQVASESGQEGRDGTALTAAIDKLLCAKSPTKACVASIMNPWAKRIGEDFNTDEHWLNAGWRVVGRLPSIARVQLGYWVETILQDGVTAAKQRGITTRGGTASVMSAQSSGIGTTMFAIGEMNPRAGSRMWNLAMVPANALPTDASTKGAAPLQDWKALVAWQYYTVKKQTVRSRMAEIWRVFYEPTWGPLIVPTATSALKHNGCYMRQDAFDFTVRVSDDPYDCTKPIPAISPEPCARWI